MKKKNLGLIIFFLFVGLWLLFLPLGYSQAGGDRHFKTEALKDALHQQAASGNPEAQFLITVMQSEDARNIRILNNTIPQNAAQSLLMGWLYQNKKDGPKAAYWYEQTKAFLKMHQPDWNIPFARFSSVNANQINGHYANVMNEIGLYADKGSPEAIMLQQILSAHALGNHAALAQVVPNTASEAFLILTCMNHLDNPRALYLIDLVSVLVRTPQPMMMAQGQHIPQQPPGGTHDVPSQNPQYSRPAFENNPQAQQAVPFQEPKGLTQGYVTEDPNLKPFQPSEKLPPADLPSRDLNGLRVDKTEPSTGEGDAEASKEEDSNEEMSGQSFWDLPEAELEKIEHLSTRDQFSEAEKNLYLGYQYFVGKGVPQNRSLAAVYVEKSANAGHALAQGLLSEMYYQGQGVAKNYSKSAYWLQKSIDNGCKLGFSHLGNLYFRGLGVPQSFAKAEEWFKKAFDSDPDPRNMYNLGLVYAKQRKYMQAEPLLLEAYKKRAKDADIVLAMCYSEQNKFTKAFSFWKIAALRGHPVSIYNVSVFYANGDGVPQSDVKAYYFAGMAAKHGVKGAVSWKQELSNRLTITQIKQLDNLIKTSDKISTDYI